MNISPLRGLIFLLIGMPIGFILSALGFVINGNEIDAAELAPFALAIAAIIGIGATFWKPKQ